MPLALKTNSFLHVQKFKRQLDAVVDLPLAAG